MNEILIGPRPNFCEVCSRSDNLTLHGRFWLCETCFKSMNFDPPIRNEEVPNENR